MGSAFAIDNVSRLSDAFILAPCVFAKVFANLIAADNLLFGRSDRFLQFFGHFEVSLGSVRGKSDRA